MKALPTFFIRAGIGDQRDKHDECRDRAYDDVIEDAFTALVVEFLAHSPGVTKPGDRKVVEAIFGCPLQVLIDRT